MENSYHALIMAGSVILFIVALSVGVYLYTKVLNTNNAILTQSEYYDKTAEEFEVADYNATYYRKYTGAEVAMQIISMYEGKDFAPTKISVLGDWYDGTNKGERYIKNNRDRIKAIANSTSLYKASFSFSGSDVIVTYSITYWLYKKEFVW